MDDRELKRLEAEITGKVLLRFHVESSALLVREAATACRQVLTAHEGLEKAPKSGPAWVAAFDQFDAALRRVAKVISAFDQLSCLVLAIHALEKEAGQGEEGH